ncbi:MAG: putative toxin-antitoxin system toxin component, PIN family [Planctomycetota bacterium]|jgi:putative PIN family toxin of toxin-antitoxin system|nr:putative toxin-antitoxin system toxin component, PIN family [Planctomycetota bacterium]
MNVILDTNILVSALKKISIGDPAKIVNLWASKAFTLFYSPDIYDEYLEVLTRPEIKIPPKLMMEILHRLTTTGIEIDPPTSRIDMAHAADRKFYDVAVAADAFLITGNTTHYPPELFILAPNRFLEAYDICCRDHLSRRQFLELYARQER